MSEDNGHVKPSRRKFSYIHRFRSISVRHPNTQSDPDNGGFALVGRRLSNAWTQPPSPILLVPNEFGGLGDDLSLELDSSVNLNIRKTKKSLEDNNSNDEITLDASIFEDTSKSEVIDNSQEETRRTVRFSVLESNTKSNDAKENEVVARYQFGEFDDSILEMDYDNDEKEVKQREPQKPVQAPKERDSNVGYFSNYSSSEEDDSDEEGIITNMNGKEDDSDEKGDISNMSGKEDQVDPITLKREQISPRKSNEEQNLNDLEVAITSHHEAVIDIETSNLLPPTNERLVATSESEDHKLKEDTKNLIDEILNAVIPEKVR
jgi:hypothetical protein